MSIPCFLLDKFNVRSTHHDCDTPDCDCGGWDEQTFDIVRADTKELLRSDAHHLGGVPVGAMWFVDMTEAHRPTGPQDYNGRAEEDLQLLRQHVREHPEWWQRHGVDAATGLPNRSPSYTFADGPHLKVMTPGGEWNIDSRGSNCTMPWDFSHRCWVRHGEPPLITVDKDGITCAAGAGSIQCGTYHGFLRDGELTD